MSAPQKLTTQKDVARLANVSQAVVSVVLGGKPGNIGVSAEVSTRVHNAAKRLHYRPNLSARSMRHGRFFNIGYFAATNDFGEVDFAQFRAGIYDAASEQGFHVMMIRLPSHLAKDPDAIPKTFNEAHLDAMIINPFSIPISEIKEVVGHGNTLPVVYLNAKEQYCSVYVDDYLGGRMATQHLFDQGYRRIAFFHTGLSEEADHYSKKDRIEGYMSVMAEHGLVAQIKRLDADIYAMDGGLVAEEFPGKTAILNWLRDSNRPEAIFCYNDGEAMILQQLLYAIHVRVPEDIAIIGYNNDESCRFSTTPLSSVHIPRYEMAVATVNMAISLINKGGEAYRSTPSIKFTPRISPRQSTAPAKSFEPALKTNQVGYAVHGE